MPGDPWWYGFPLSGHGESLLLPVAKTHTEHPDPEGFYGQYKEDRRGYSR